MTDRNPFGPYNELIAAILGDLQSEGLRRQALQSQDYEGRVSGPENRRFGDFFLDTVEWLVAENLIRAGPYSFGKDITAHNVALTASALAYLNAPLDALKGQTPGDVLARNKRGDESVSNWVKAGSFLGSGLDGFTKSIGG
jgi:hypothetical protein